MPTLAFNNLSEFKKNKLLEDGFNAFSKLRYRTTNVNEITKEIGITRTAFYYYFTDKKDFYECLVSSKKEDYMKKHVINQKEKLDFFDLLLELFDYLAEYKGSKHEGFFIDLFYNIDYVEQNNLLNQIINKENIETYTYISGLEKFIMDSKEEIFEFVILLFEIVFHTMLNYFLTNISKEAAKLALKRKFEYLKNGIIKKEFRGENI